MSKELTDAAASRRTKIGQFLRGAVTDRFLKAGAAGLAAGFPITPGLQVTDVTDTIPGYTPTIEGPVTDAIGSQITAITGLIQLATPNITDITPTDPVTIITG